MTEADIRAGGGVLSRYSTRLHPRLHDLTRHGVRVGVLTDVPYGRPRGFVERDLAPIAEYLDATFMSVEVGCRKPHPSGYLMLAEWLGVEPFDMAHIGNEEQGIVGANEAGMFSVLIDRTGERSDFGQRRTTASLQELVELKEWAE